MTYAMLIGRWQPFHKGHKILVQKVLDEGQNVLVAIRDTKMSKDDPYTTKERKKMIRKAFPDKEKVRIIVIPDIHAVVYGRKVGYEIREIRLDDKTEAISGTNIRNNNI